MNINILYLYYDLLNLYGEIGNIKILKYHLEKQGIKVNIDKLSLEDDIDFSSYDLVYMGSGTEGNLKLVYDNLKKYKKDIIDSINNNKYFLVTGNAIDLFTKDYLNIFNLEIKDIDKRYNKEVVLDDNFTKSKIYGALNRNGIIKNNFNPLFENDGILKNNFFGTNLIGPLLVKNPAFFKYFIKRLIKNKNNKFKFKKFDLKLEERAYLEYKDFKDQKKNKFKE